MLIETAVLAFLDKRLVAQSRSLGQGSLILQRQGKEFTSLCAVFILCLFVKVGDVAVGHSQICRTHDGVIDGIFDKSLVRERWEIGDAETIGVKIAFGFDDGDPRLGKMREVLLLLCLVVDLLCLIDHLAGHILLLEVRDVVPKFIVTLAVRTENVHNVHDNSQSGNKKIPFHDARVLYGLDRDGRCLHPDYVADWLISTLLRCSAGRRGWHPHVRPPPSGHPRREWPRSDRGG